MAAGSRGEDPVERLQWTEMQANYLSIVRYLTESEVNGGSGGRLRDARAPWAAHRNRPADREIPRSMKIYFFPTMGYVSLLSSTEPSAAACR
ncbi:protein of unknown function [Burkholderia multivorans]